MKRIFFMAAIAAGLSACETAKPVAQSPSIAYADTLLTQSLFMDREATITEEGIRKVLDGTFALPAQLRVAIVRLEGNGPKRYYWSDEEYIKTNQAYLDAFSEIFRQSARVTKLSAMPDLLLSKPPSFTNIREAAVRMQADVAVVYSITSDLYSKYRLFTRPDTKAFATTQLIILDVRTGLIPFSATVTKDYLSPKKREELDVSEARARVQNEAVLLTIHELGQKITAFLKEK